VLGPAVARWAFSSHRGRCELRLLTKLIFALGRATRRCGLRRRMRLSIHARALGKWINLRLPSFVNGKPFGSSIQRMTVRGLRLTSAANASISA
jgi:hypothetical protein